MSEGRAVPGPPVAQIALNGLCPRCGAPSLFTGWASVAERCSGCGLDFARFVVGDRLAAVLVLILGAALAALAITLDQAIHPPLWLELVVWVPVTAATVVLALRATKAAAIALHYRASTSAAPDKDRS